RRRQRSRAASRQSGLRAAATAAAAAPTTSTPVTMLETTCGSIRLFQTHPGVDQRVAQVGQDLAEDEGQGADVDHGAQGREVVVVDGVDGEGTEARDAEERLEQERAREEERDRDHHLRQDGNERVA